MKETILQAFNWRYATKIFDTNKKVSQDDIDTIIESARMAPTAYGLQPFQIIKVQDEALRLSLRTEASFGQAQVTDASDFFVIAARTDVDESYITDYISRIAKTRDMDTTDLEGFKQTMIGDICGRTPEMRLSWASKQAYIALGSMIETAALVGVDACPMEGFVPTKVDEILGLSAHNLTSLAYLAVGYRGEDYMAQAKKVRFSKEQILLIK